MRKERIGIWLLEVGLLEIGLIRLYQAVQSDATASSGDFSGGHAARTKPSSSRRGSAQS
jgi:hypothetical protein